MNNRERFIRTALALAVVLTACAPVETPAATSTDTSEPKPTNSLEPVATALLATVTSEPSSTPETCRLDRAIILGMRGPEGGVIVPSEDQIAVLPAPDKWTEEQKTKIVDGAGNPVWPGQMNIVNSKWARENQLTSVGAWVAEGCGIGQIYKNKDGNLVWATIKDETSGLPDGNGVADGVKKVAAAPETGEPYLLITEQGTLLMLRQGDMLNYSYDEVRDIWSPWKYPTLTPTDTPTLTPEPPTLTPVPPTSTPRPPTAIPATLAPTDLPTPESLFYPGTWPERTAARKTGRFVIDGDPVVKDYCASADGVLQQFTTVGGQIIYAYSAHVMSISSDGSLEVITPDGLRVFSVDLYRFYMVNHPRPEFVSSSPAVDLEIGDCLAASYRDGEPLTFLAAR